MIDKAFWKDKRVLVTGHTGFKGSWLSMWLTSLGAKVHGISLPPNSENCLFTQARVESIISSNNFCDICNLNKLKSIVIDINPEIVFHLAAQPLVIKSYHYPLETWNTNVMGSLNLLESVKISNIKRTLIMITTDKVYENKDWDYGYREDDRLGGKDPYSASKAACEIAISSWRESFCGSKLNQNQYLSIASARSGNVIGGGDWAENRIIPDAIRSLQRREAIQIRNPKSTRPWQHVLDPLSGYLLLAEKLYNSKSKDYLYKNIYESSFNFGPSLKSNHTVISLIKKIIKYWPGEWKINSENNFHESSRLHLNIDKAYNKLNWSSKWSFDHSVKRTVKWYKRVFDGQTDAQKATMDDIMDYEKEFN